MSPVAMVYDAMGDRHVDPPAKRVDVLAVMDSAEVRCGPALAAATVEARAAVAELIEAAKFARLTGNGPTGYTPGADRRLAAALAGVGAA